MRSLGSFHSSFYFSAVIIAAGPNVLIRSAKVKVKIITSINSKTRMMSSSNQNTSHHMQVLYIIYIILYIIII